MQDCLHANMEILGAELTRKLTPVGPRYGRKQKRWERLPESLQVFWETRFTWARRMAETSLEGYAADKSISKRWFWSWKGNTSEPDKIVISDSSTTPVVCLTARSEATALLATILLQRGCRRREMHSYWTVKGDKAPKQSAVLPIFSNMKCRGL